MHVVAWGKASEKLPFLQALRDYTYQHTLQSDRDV